jgi:hypothetical protein
LAFGCLQNVFWRLADRDGIRRPHEGYYRASVLSFISEERDSIGDIYVDDLPTFVTALDPGPHCSPSTPLSGLFLGRDPHDMDGIADYVGGAFLAFGASGH